VQNVQLIRLMERIIINKKIVEKLGNVPVDEEIGTKNKTEEVKQA
jgi:hypothetical protein